jgi:hypothetical protein
MPVSAVRSPTTQDSCKTHSAGATLRAHPNIGFANLDLLANVVAKRTICTGSERRDAEGKVVRVDREGVEEALELLDHVSG